MKIKVGSIILLVILIAAAVQIAGIAADAAPTNEYKIKAAFLFNFIKFSTWPESKFKDDKTIIIGIIGNNPFGRDIDVISKEKINNQPITIQRFGLFGEIAKLDSKSKEQKINEIRKCSVLYIAQSENANLKEIFAMTKDASVLTVGDYPDFSDAGGIINLVMEESKVRFEVNFKAAEESKIQIRSQLLRLARNQKDVK